MGVTISLLESRSSIKLRAMDLVFCSRTLSLVMAQPAVAARSVVSVYQVAKAWLVLVLASRKTSSYKGARLGGPVGKWLATFGSLSSSLTKYLCALPLMSSLAGKCGYKPPSSNLCTPTTAAEMHLCTTKKS